MKYLLLFSISYRFLFWKKFIYNAPNLSQKIPFKNKLPKYLMGFHEILEDSTYLIWFLKIFLRISKTPISAKRQLRRPLSHHHYHRCLFTHCQKKINWEYYDHANIYIKYFYCKSEITSYLETIQCCQVVKIIIIFKKIYIFLYEHVETHQKQNH